VPGYFVVGCFVSVSFSANYINQCANSALTLPSDFPDSGQLPVVQFDDALFHPFVNSKTKCTDLQRYFPSGRWQRDRNHIYQVLIATQSMFFRCRVESGQAANPEAAILLAENPAKFRQMARDVVR